MKNCIVPKIKGIGSYVPDRKVTNNDVLNKLKQQSGAYLEKEELELLLYIAQKGMKKAGCNNRNRCDEDEYCTDIAYNASLKALENANMAADEIDLIIFTGMSKAFLEPATAHLLKNKLGAYNANVIDTQDACTSFIKSLEIAGSLIVSKTYKKILIAAGERSFDWADYRCKTVDELKWKMGSLTIGDAAGAIIVEGTEESEYKDNAHHWQCFFKLMKDSFSTCSIGLNHSVGDRYKLYSHSGRLIKQGEEIMAELCTDVFRNQKWRDFQIDNLLLHDVGNIITGRIYNILKNNEVEYSPQNFHSFFSETGNIASASLPIGMCRAKEEGRLERGNNVLFICPSAGVQAGLMFFKY